MMTFILAEKLLGESEYFSVVTEIEAAFRQSLQELKLLEL